MDSKFLVFIGSGRLGFFLEEICCFLVFMDCGQNGYLVFLDVQAP